MTSLERPGFRSTRSYRFAWGCPGEGVVTWCNCPIEKGPQLDGGRPRSYTRTIQSWQGEAINSFESGSLEGPAAPAIHDDWTAITPGSTLYDDTGGTSFGAANVDWEEQQFHPIQDVTPLRAWAVIPEPGGCALLASALPCLLTLVRRRYRIAEPR